MTEKNGVDMKVVDEVLREWVERSRAALGDELVSVVLFGTALRGAR